MSNLTVFLGSFNLVNSLTKKFLRTSSVAKKLAVLKELKNVMSDYRVDGNPDLLRESLRTHRNLSQYISDITNGTPTLSNSQLVAKVNKKGRMVAKPSHLTFVIKYDNKECEVLNDSAFFKKPYTEKCHGTMPLVPKHTSGHLN